MSPTARAASCVAACLLLAGACRLEHREPPPDTGAAAAADSMVDESGLSTGEELNSFRRDKHFDFTGDGHPEELKVRASGVTSDGLTVTLRIEDPRDSVLYFDSWSSARYLDASDARARADRRVVRAIVQGELERVLADSNLGPPVARWLRAAEGSAAGGRAAGVQRDLAEAEWRRQRGIHPDSALGQAALDSVTALARAPSDRARVRRIVGELAATDRYFRYFRGARDTVVVAWSPSERRFVRVRYSSPDSLRSSSALRSTPQR